MWYKISKWALIGFSSWFILHSLIICIDGLTNDNAKADVALIFGNTVHPSRQVSDRLQARLDCGLEAWKNQRVKKIVVSGGFGKEGHWEAQVMKSYLLQKGVPLQDLIVDDYGNTTRLSAQNLKNLAQKYQINSVMAISQFHHISRCKLALRQAGFQQVSGSSPTYFEWRDLFAIVREFPAYYKYLFRL